MRAVVVVDAANVVGSRPDGWWRDRAGAAKRLLARLAALPGTDVEVAGRTLAVEEVVVVLEGRARDAATGQDDGVGLRVVRAAGSGDDAIVEVCEVLTGPCVVVTADRGLRERLPETATPVGPRWLDDVLGRS